MCSCLDAASVHVPHTCTQYSYAFDKSRSICTGNRFSIMNFFRTGGSSPVRKNRIYRDLNANRKSARFNHRYMLWNYNSVNIGVYAARSLASSLATRKHE